jgi:DNA-binding NarL/FixJ family response regulator
MDCVTVSPYLNTPAKICGSDAQAPGAYRVLVVDNLELIRCSVRSLYPDIEGAPIEWLEAGSLDQALDVYARHEPVDAVLLDLNLNDCRGLQGLHRFLQRYPGARVAIFSGTQDEFVVRQARALGAAAYLYKGALVKDMRRTLAALLNGRAEKLPGGLSGGSLLFPKHTATPLLDRVGELGPRHLEILELVLCGCGNQEISRCMSLSLGTVKNYVSVLLLALDVKSRSHLISLFR